jgi:MFS family permease
MSEGKVFNRWLVVLGALVIQVSLGAVYIWSVFQTPLKALFPNWTEAQVTLPAQIVLAAFALAVIFGGRIQDRLGPRIVATAGGLILGAGLILARFTGNFPPGAALTWLIVTFSILGGIGIGAGYVCPIATCVKWFPDKRGLITGLAVAGFGAGAFFFAPLAKGLITGGKYQVLGANLFGLPKLGVFNTFMALGMIFLVAIVLGAQLLRNPPAGFRPAGWNPPDSYAFAESVLRDGKPWCRQEAARLQDGIAEVTFASSMPLDRAELVTTSDTGFTGDSSRRFEEGIALPFEYAADDRTGPPRAPAHHLVCEDVDLPPALLLQEADR